MIGQAHGLGLKVFLVIVLHGVTDKTHNPESSLIRTHWSNDNPTGLVIMYMEDWQELIPRHSATGTSKPAVRVEGFNFYVDKLNKRLS